MTRPRAPPRIVERSLRPVGGRCYRHCDRPLRSHAVRLGGPGTGWVLACPSGVVSVTRYVEWSDRPPTARLWRELRRRTVPPTLVRRRDLRSATRHGPELGRPAERDLARRPGAAVRVVYWRLYPFRRRGIEHRLFVCLRHGRREAVFFAAPTSGDAPRCPRCGSAVGARRRSNP